MKIFRQQSGLSATIRVFSGELLPVEERDGLNDLAPFASMHAGLILVSGLPGAGVTSSVASFLLSLANKRRGHILTFDEASELKIMGKKSLVSQLFTGSGYQDVIPVLNDSYSSDCDVIAVGKLESHKKIETVFEHLDLGKLVVAEVTAPTAVEAIKKIIQKFHRGQGRHQIKAKLSQYLLAAFEQSLTFSKEDKEPQISLTKLLMNPSLGEQIMAENFEALRKEFYNQEGFGESRLVENGAIYYDELEHSIKATPEHFHTSPSLASNPAASSIETEEPSVAENQKPKQESISDSSISEMDSMSLDLPDLSNHSAVSLQGDSLDKLLTKSAIDFENIDDIEAKNTEEDAA